MSNRNGNKQIGPPCGRTRRQFLWEAGAGFAGVALAGLLGDDGFLGSQAYAADEAFCTGTMGELAAVTSIDGRTIGDGRPGPMVARLSALFGELTQRDGTVVVEEN